MQKDSLFAFILIVIFGAFFVFPASAAESSFKLEGEPTVGGSWKVRIDIDTALEKINAIGGEVVYPDIARLVGVETAGSFINLWVEQPKADGQRLRFSGITPGGFQGKGEVLALVFEGTKVGAGELVLENAEAYLNDGKGTRTDLTESKMPFRVESSNGAVPRVLKDNVPPQPFSLVLGKSKTLFDDKWFAAFSAQDKESAIDHYEVQEGPMDPKESGWIKAASPYLLKDQKLGSYIHVRAIDLAGNTTVSTLAPSKSANFRDILFWGILIMLSAAGVFYIWHYLRGRKGQK